jgi:hypothetical protein
MTSPANRERRKARAQCRGIKRQGTAVRNIVVSLVCVSHLAYIASKTGPEMPTNRIAFRNLAAFAHGEIQSQFLLALLGTSVAL